jgi:hypothetical protein
MQRQARRVVGALSAIVTLAAVAAAPAVATTSGAETFNGVIVTSGRSGERTVLASPIVARGVFSGVGRLVEVPNLPGDPDNVSRDDLVFARGTFHIVSENQDVTFDLNPRSCVFNVKIEQTGRIEGGTGRFSAATGNFVSTVRAHGLTARNADGSCSEEQAPLAEVDTLTSSGMLSF